MKEVRTLVETVEERIRGGHRSESSLREEGFSELCLDGLHSVSAVPYRARDVQRREGRVRQRAW